jgi:hypothetical protein
MQAYGGRYGILKNSLKNPMYRKLCGFGAALDVEIKIKYAVALREI